MSGVGFELELINALRVGAALLLTGLAIRLMDDFLDLRYDAQAGIPSPAVRLGEATLPYGLLALAAGAALHAPTSLTLFFAAYAVGMIQDLRRPLPSGIAGWQEGGIVLVFGALLLGFWTQVWALAVMLFIQAVDDLLDYRLDRMSGNPNLVRAYGYVEVCLVALLCLVIAAMLQPIGTGMAIAAAAILDAVLWRIALRGGRGASEAGPLPKGWLS